MQSNATRLLRDVYDASESAGRVDLPYNREDFAAYLALKGYTRGAEVGVEQGLYSEVLLAANPKLELVSVDAWSAYQGYREHVTQAKVDGLHAKAVERLRRFSGSVLRRMYSVEAAMLEPNGSLDFVYIDGNHRYEQVVADIAAWAPKVKPGGIVAGHDYRKMKGTGPFHVVQAVDGWVSAYQIAPLFVLRGDRSPTWFWVA